MAYDASGQGLPNANVSPSDNNDRDQVERIMAAQMARQERLQRADIVIDNSTTLEELDNQVQELHGEFLLRAEQSANQP